MTAKKMSRVIERLRQAATAPDDVAASDGELLGRFVRQREERAFATLVRRHGPMVLGVCRRVVGNLHDAEDAFQATFLVLAQKAAVVKPRELVASWLYGVAYRIALRDHKASSRR